MDEDYETRMQHNQLMRRKRQGKKDDERRRLRLQQHLKDLRELRRIRQEREARQQQLQQAEQQRQQMEQQQHLQEQLLDQELREALQNMVILPPAPPSPRQRGRYRQRVNWERHRSLNRLDNINLFDHMENSSSMRSPLHQIQEEAGFPQHHDHPVNTAGLESAEHEETMAAEAATPPQSGRQRGRSMSHLDLAFVDMDEVNLLVSAAEQTLEKGSATKSVMHKLQTHAAISSICKDEIKRAVTRIDTSAEENSTATDSAENTSSDSTSMGASEKHNFHGFSHAIPHKLSTLERGYLSPTSSEEFHSPPEDPQEQSLTTTPTKTTAPSHPLPVKRKTIGQQLKALDKNTTILARNILLGTNQPPLRQVPTINIVGTLGRSNECPVCDNSRFLALAPPIRSGLRCSCNNRVINEGNPPLLPPLPAPDSPESTLQQQAPLQEAHSSPETSRPVTRNKGVPQGIWNIGRGIFTKNQR